MSLVPIKQIEIEKFGCIKKASFSLSPLHALIGPNDSGKSTILKALRESMQQLAKGFRDTDQGLRPFHPWIFDFSEDDRKRIVLFSADEFQYEIDISRDTIVENFSKEGRLLVKNESGYIPKAFSTVLARHNIVSKLSPPTMVRFDPDALRKPAPLIPDTTGIAFADERGAGLAGVYDAIINRDVESFTQIQADIRKLFPSVAKVGLINVSDTHKTISVTLEDGTRLGAESMSEGMLYYLGFAALKYIDGSNLLLVEEPENGLHPTRIVEVMGALREISKTSQVIIATHSPLVINELKGHEVSVITRDSSRGTQGVLLKDVPHFEASSKVYQPGELWLSYADGHLEAPLLNGTPRT